jgi:mannose-6-phosphate isomerase-like protein (cupin superfamily)
VNPETGETIEVKAGEAAWIPAGGWHVAFNFGEEEAIVIAIIAGKIWDEDAMGSAIEFTGKPQYLKA